MTVTDEEAPSITAPSDRTITSEEGLCGVSDPNLGTPVTADNCGVDLVENDAANPLPVGENTITWTVTDIHGNTATATQTVTVTDIEAPTITPADDVVASSDEGICEASGVDLGTPETGDNCAVDLVENNAPETFPVGQTTVTWTVKIGRAHV